MVRPTDVGGRSRKSPEKIPDRFGAVDVVVLRSQRQIDRAHEPRVATSLAYQFSARLAFGLVEIDYNHLSAALGKAKCAGATDAATTAGDECNFTREFHRMFSRGRDAWMSAELTLRSCRYWRNAIQSQLNEGFKAAPMLTPEGAAMQAAVIAALNSSHNAGSVCRLGQGPQDVAASPSAVLRSPPPATARAQ